MKKIILPIFITILSYACNTSQQEKDTIVEESTKREVIENFKLKMTQLSDSTLYYLDYAIAEIKKGTKKDSIEKKVKTKLTFFEKEIGETSKNFGKKAKELKLTKEEMAALKIELSDAFNEIQEKFNQLTKQDSLNLR